MASSELSADAIESFISFTNATREQAIAFLEANNHDSNRAINAYFENPGSVQAEVWPMPPSSQQERYGYQNQNVPSFRIDADPVHPVGYRSAPSRPPSRIGSHDHLEDAKLGQPIRGSTNRLDDVGEPGPTVRMSLAEQEEHELQRAVALSLNAEFAGNGDISIDEGGQETGVVQLHTNHTSFGPATKSHYEETAWALTLLDTTARDVCIHPDPEERKRANDEPAFLRPSADMEYLAGFVTILHAIPLAREALLLRDKVIRDYGNDPQWWNGQPINLPASVTLADDGYMDEDEPNVLLLETQRLMAFLDSTHRAFGSADILANLDYSRSDNSDDYSIGQFLESWQISAVTATPDNQLATVFSSMASKRPFSINDEPIDREFLTLTLSVYPEYAETLYDVMDTSMWNDSMESELDDIWIDRIGEVFSLRLDAAGDQKSVNVKIPAVWYPDRYMEACRDISRDIRKKRIEAYIEIERLHDLMQRFSTLRIGDYTSHIKNSFNLAVNALQVASRNNLANGSHEGAEDTPDQTIVSHEAVIDLANELRGLTEKIDEKLQCLEERKYEALASLRRYSKELTTPSDDPTKPPYNKYTLRGVCTLPHVTYVLRRCKKLVDDTDESTSTNPTPDAWQWWRISFSVDDAKARHAEATQTPIVPSSQQYPAKAQPQKRPRVPLPTNADVAGYSVRPVREIEVLRAAKDESRSVILVYANENAVNFKEEPLPPELQAFVDADNKAFGTELEEIARRIEQGDETVPSSENLWSDLEPLGGQSDDIVIDGAQQIDVRNVEMERVPKSLSSTEEVEVKQGNCKKQGSYDERDPTRMLSKSAALPTTNVFDYEVSSFSDTPPSEEERGPEMQERAGGSGSGRGILGVGSDGNSWVNFSMPPSDPMDGIRKEGDNNDSNPDKVLLE
ncbi:ubiquitin interaction motif protein [Paracoccidioides lutzii Pb01]|uniref:Ubiquitin interaction motif protein n=1 Tax=Paracoccidioides lutzii (strain ATCC MYA-826 / Pb01) TaxID=502779 RepID=C1GZT4_PARBA|nr:ubiquitin interaction motif protein [Paracoccidioides lutzii Pb01]EEH32975.1 ubiquitin interaction motif protein [Paracoccidioides lutzii Pb01]